MSKIAKYKTARAEHASDLDKEINKLLKEGWQPFGSPYVSSKTNDSMVSQAMVQYVDTAESKIG